MCLLFSAFIHIRLFLAAKINGLLPFNGNRLVPLIFALFLSLIPPLSPVSSLSIACDDAVLVYVSAWFPLFVMNVFTYYYKLATHSVSASLSVCVWEFDWTIRFNENVTHFSWMLLDAISFRREKIEENRSFYWFLFLLRRFTNPLIY